MIIGLSGYARSGKDECAKALVEQGWRRVAFADKLREFLYRLNPIVIPGVQEAFGAFVGPADVQSIIDQYGWDGYKQTPYAGHLREYLQRLGTECGRQLISDSIWVDAALGDPSKPSIRIAEAIVVTDVRFPNEAQAIKNRNGIVLRVVRPGVGPANAHPSETALDDWNFDGTINNVGTIEDLHDRARFAAHNGRTLLLEK